MAMHGGEAASGVIRDDTHGAKLHGSLSVFSVCVFSLYFPESVAKGSF